MPVAYITIMIAFLSCVHSPEKIPCPAVDNTTVIPRIKDSMYTSIGAIPLPPGYTRLPAVKGSYAAWLRCLPLKKSNTVFLYNGQPKANQSAQFAVIDMPVGNKDLQQCADAVMRLYAEYNYSRQQFGAIDFTDNAQIHYRLKAGASRAVFNQYLEKVFSYCGTASLEKQLVAVNELSEVQAGDVLIKGGAPGHAMQVVDAAINTQGKKIYLLAQSYMPAQDIHVVVNPAGGQLNPWYAAEGKALIETPEWVFGRSNLRKWPKNY